MPDLTPEQVNDLLATAHIRFVTSAPDESAEEHTIRRLVDACRQLQRQRVSSFTEGRRQGWQDAGLSLDAQEVLAASLAMSPEDSNAQR